MKPISKLVVAFVFAAPAAASAGGLSAGVRIDLAPLGTFHVESEGGGSDDSDMAFAYGFAAQVDYWVTPQISVGVAPRFLLNVKGEGSDADEEDAGKQLDIPVRVAYNHMINDKLTGFGYGTLGYSVIMFPDTAPAELDNPTGLSVGFGAGGRWALSEKMFASAELGYDIGFQGYTLTAGDESVDLTTATRFLHIGLGVGSTF